MRIHKKAVAWVARRVGGVINHVSENPFIGQYRIGGYIPDVVKERIGLRDQTEIHEVEVVGLSERKISTYANCLVLSSQKGILWIVLPSGTSNAFDEIRLIEQVGINTFHQIARLKTRKIVGGPPSRADRKLRRAKKEWYKKNPNNGLW